MSRARKIALVGVSSLLMTIVLVSCISGTSRAAEDFDLLVFGYVYDEGGNPAEGVPVVVEELDTAAGGSDTTDALGRYMVTIAKEDWNIGDDVRVTATYSAVELIDTAVADDTYQIQIDFHYEYAIPEFGSIFGVVVATVFMGCVAVMSVRRRRAQ
jgi:hypothetical protein